MTTWLALQIRQLTPQCGSPVDTAAEQLGLQLNHNKSCTTVHVLFRPCPSSSLCTCGGQSAAGGRTPRPRSCPALSSRSQSLCSASLFAGPRCRAGRGPAGPAREALLAPQRRPGAPPCGAGPVMADKRPAERENRPHLLLRPRQWRRSPHGSKRARPPAPPRSSPVPVDGCARGCRPGRPGPIRARLTGSLPGRAEIGSQERAGDLAQKLDTEI